MEQLCEASSFKTERQKKIDSVYGWFKGNHVSASQSMHPSDSVLIA